MSAVSPLAGQLRFQSPLKRLNTWRVGGAADQFYRPASITDLSEYLLGLAPDLPVFWLGFGSNLLVRDGGVRGSVITLREALNEISLDCHGRLKVQAGAPCAKVARQCAAAGFSGLECFAGIPGTVGGALAMNAGAFGQETWEPVVEVETISRTGQIRRRAKSEFEIGYRSVKGFPQEWFLSAEFQLAPGNAADISARIAALVAKRNLSQPMGVASCGSVFRNPPGQYAADLIERAGFKGYSHAAAQVSERHANFIVNRGGAYARDIESLILRVQDEVRARFDIELETEVRMIGEHEE